MSDFEIIEHDLQSALKLCSEGQKSAFNIVYKHTSVKFTAIVSGRVRDETLAADILQRAYVSIWKNAHKFDPEKGKAFTWMLVILRNRSIDVLRKNKRYLVTDILDETIADESSQTDRRAKSAMIGRLITPHMNDLPVHVAHSIKLHVVYGWSNREIGEFYDVPTHTAKSWIRRGLKKLKGKMPAEKLETLL